DGFHGNCGPGSAWQRLGRLGREQLDGVAHADGPAAGDFGELAQRTEVIDDGFAALGPLQAVAASARLGDLNDGLAAELQPVARLQFQERQALDDDLLAELAGRGTVALGLESLQPLKREQVELPVGVAPGFLVAVDAVPGDQAGTFQREAYIVLPVLSIVHPDWLVNDTGNLCHLKPPPIMLVLLYPLLCFWLIQLSRIIENCREKSRCEERRDDSATVARTRVSTGKPLRIGRYRSIPLSLLVRIR
ncbi:MAG TPA: hypothetical protein VE136_15865, partial [Anaerolineales bacterium]|nr:hypothetical protein [Anaerolineales bacterium]